MPWSAKSNVGDLRPRADRGEPRKPTPCVNNSKFAEQSFFEPRGLDQPAAIRPSCTPPSRTSLGMSLLSLPPETIAVILAFSAVEDVYTLRNTCCCLREAVDNSAHALAAARALCAPWMQPQDPASAHGWLQLAMAELRRRTTMHGHAQHHHHASFHGALDLSSASEGLAALPRIDYAEEPEPIQAVNTNLAPEATLYADIFPDGTLSISRAISDEYETKLCFRRQIVFTHNFPIYPQTYGDYASNVYTPPVDGVQELNYARRTWFWRVVRNIQEDDRVIRRFHVSKAMYDGYLTALLRLRSTRLAPGMSADMEWHRLGHSSSSSAGSTSDSSTGSIGLCEEYELLRQKCISPGRRNSIKSQSIRIHMPCSESARVFVYGHETFICISNSLDDPVLKRNDFFWVDWANSKTFRLCSTISPHGPTHPQHQHHPFIVDNRFFLLYRNQLVEWAMNASSQFVPIGKTKLDLSYRRDFSLMPQLDSRTPVITGQMFVDTHNRSYSKVTLGDSSNSFHVLGVLNGQKHDWTYQYLRELTEKLTMYRMPLNTWCHLDKILPGVILSGGAQDEEERFSGAVSPTHSI
ncbi:hypothetical protein CJU89_1471 [Yarrowia sp. B02]|nr:hypothetical protein CJU89_1471 [Yarrowia sp. B02]